MRILFLVLSVVALAASFTQAGGEFMGGALKPLSAIFFIAFFMLQLLKNEIPQFEEDRRRSLEQAYGRKELAPGDVAHEDASEHDCPSDHLQTAERFSENEPRYERCHDRLHEQVQR